MKTTPTLTSAIARLCAVLRELGLDQHAHYVERYADKPASLGDQLDGAADECLARGARIRGTILGGGDEAAFVRAQQLEMAGLAARWLADGACLEDGEAGVRLDPSDADRMARIALALLAWPDARDLRARAVSAERDRRALIALRDHLFEHPVAKAAAQAYVVSRWESAELSEGMASYLLGVDRLEAREIRDRITGDPSACEGCKVETRTAGAYVDLHGHTCGKTPECVECHEKLDPDGDCPRAPGFQPREPLLVTAPTLLMRTKASEIAGKLSEPEIEALRWCSIFPITRRPGSGHERPALPVLNSLRDLGLIDRPFASGLLTDLGRLVLRVLDAAAGSTSAKGATT